jgi:hypothetical protein
VKAKLTRLKQLIEASSVIHDLATGKAKILIEKGQQFYKNCLAVFLYNIYVSKPQRSEGVSI